ncbi:MAG TPA: oligoendopeptidase F [Myxococcales bacterium]
MSGLIALTTLAMLTTAAPPATKASATPAYVPDANLERSKVPDGYKWKLAPLFADDAAFEAALVAAPAARAKVAAFKGKLADPKALRECLDLYFATRRDVNRLTLYSNLRFDSDQKNEKLQAMSDRALAAMNEFMGATTFIRQEVLKLDDAAMTAALAKEPKLASDYKVYLTDIRRRRAHVLGEEAERVLALAKDNLWAEIDLNEIPSDHEKVFNAVLSDIPLPKITDEAGKEVQLTLANYPKYRASKDRKVRQEAVEKLFGTLKQYQHAFAGTLSGQVNLNVFSARARGYDSALAAYLDKDDISPAVYKNLVDTVRKNVAPLHRYVALRKKLLGLPDLHIYDLYTPMVASVKEEIPYSKAMELIPAALAPLGPDYVKALKAGLDPASGWIDVYPNKDKDSGAFSSSVYGIHPFVKMNYMDDLDGLSTLAHEYGHALHSHLSYGVQPIATANYSMFVAEIASTFNEKLLNDHMVKAAKSKEERLYLLNKSVESIRTTIYRQTLFAEFELALHTAAEKGEPLTAEFMNKTYADLLKAYYGPDLTLGANDDIEWAYIPHFYYKYYVFVYATGLCSGLALAEKVGKGDAKARDAYLGMLKGGSSKPPLELLKGAGADLTRPDVIEAAAKLLDSTVAEMEKLAAPAAAAPAPAKK